MGRPVVVAITCAALSVVFPAASHAAPAPPPPPCSFMISAPLRDGATVVTTVTSTGCAAAAAPYSAVACLGQDGGAPAVCVQSHGSDPARVSIPYLPGATFTASGRGCAGWLGLPPAADCQLLGPTRVVP
ncbi:MAG: hypothetical protein ACR2JM_02770 [Mycobacterium sp.]